MYVCMYVYIYVCVYVHVCKFYIPHKSVCMSVCIYVCMYVYNIDLIGLCCGSTV